MSIGQVALGIVMFAVSTSAVYIWGLKKSLTQRDDLNRRLIGVCGRRVVKYLKKNPTATRKEIAVMVEGATVAQPWSRSRVKVQDGQKVAGLVIDFLIKEQYIEETKNGVYRLKK